MAHLNSEIDKIFRTWASLSSNFIGDCFDVARPHLENKPTFIESHAHFVSTQLYLDCHLTSESVLILIREAKEWDADLLSRSVLEGSLKYVYMVIGSSEEVNEKVYEYWDLLPLFADIKHSERASALPIDVSDADNLEWRALRELDIGKEKIELIRERYPRSLRQELEQKWSFSRILEQFKKSDNTGLALFGGMAHGYGMSSHLMHKDGDGVGMVWERSRREPNRKVAVTLGHAARIVSDICVFAKLRLLYLLKFHNVDIAVVKKLETSYSLLFDELNKANLQFCQIEYEQEDF